MVPAAVIFDVADGGPAAGAAALLFAIGSWAATFVALRYIAGLVYVADQLMQGRPAEFQDGMRAVSGHTGSLGLWALIKVAVGWLLRAVEGRQQHGVLAVVAGVALASGVGGGAGIAAGALCLVIGAGLIVVGVVLQTAARQVFGVALYRYAADGPRHRAVRRGRAGLRRTTEGFEAVGRARPRTTGPM